MQHYKLIEIFTDEEARWQGEPLPSAIIQFIHDLKIAARCLVTRGIAGSYESGEIATSRLEVLSYNMPVWIKIILPAFESDRVVAEIEKMVTNGIVTVQDLDVVSHRTPGLLMPRQTRVRDVMTTAIQKGQFGHAFGRSSPPVALLHLYRAAGGGRRESAGGYHLPK